MKVKDMFCDFDVNPISSNPLHGSITSEIIESIQLRNEEKRKASIEFLGDKWLLHPNNKVSIKELA